MIIFNQLDFPSEIRFAVIDMNSTGHGALIIRVTDFSSISSQSCYPVKYFALGELLLFQGVDPFILRMIDLGFSADPKHLSSFSLLLRAT